MRSGFITQSAFSGIAILMLAACGNAATTERDGAQPQDESAHPANTAQADATMKEQKEKSERTNAKASSAYGKYDVRGIRLGMTPDEAKRVLDSLEPQIQTSSELQFSPPVMNGPAYHSGFDYTYTAFPKNNMKTASLRFPDDEQVVSIERETHHATDRPLFSKYRAAIVQKFGEPTAEKEQVNIRDLLWVSDGPAECASLVDEPIHLITVMRSFTQYADGLTRANLSAGRFGKYLDCGEMLLVSITIADLQLGTVASVHQIVINPSVLVPSVERHMSYWDNWLKEHNAKNAVESDIADL